MKRRVKARRGTRYAKTTQALHKVQDRLARGKLSSANVILVLTHPEAKRAQKKQNRALHLLDWNHKR